MSIKNNFIPIKFKEDFSMSNQTPDFKEQAALFIGQTARFVSKGTDKVIGFVKDQKDNLVDLAKEKKDKATDYLNDAQTLYLTKKALNDEKQKLEQLYAELGKSVYNLAPVTEGRTVVHIGDDIKVTLAKIDELQKKYDALKEAYASDDNDDDTSSDPGPQEPPVQNDENASSSNDENADDDDAFVKHFYPKD